MTAIIIWADALDTNSDRKHLFVWWGPNGHLHHLVHQWSRCRHPGNKRYHCLSSQCPYSWGCWNRPLCTPSRLTQDPTSFECPLNKRRSLDSIRLDSPLVRNNCRKLNLYLHAFNTSALVSRPLGYCNSLLLVSTNKTYKTYIAAAEGSLLGLNHN